MDILLHKLTCTSCSNVFNEPKVLPCLHTFCQECISVFVTKNLIICPICNRKFELNDVDELSDNVFLYSAFDMLALMKDKSSFTCDICDNAEGADVASFRCTDCMQYLCELHANAHMKAKSTKIHHILSINDLLANWKFAYLNRPAYCEQHVKERLSTFCEECDYPVCNQCTVEQHKGHTHISIEQANSTFRPTTAKLLEKARPRIIDLRDAISGIEQMCQKISVKADAAIDDIAQCFQKQIDLLTERKEQLVNQVHNCRIERLEALHEQRDHLQMKLLSFSEMYSFVKEALHNGNVADYLDMKNAMNEQLHFELDSNIDLETVEEDYIVFHPNDVAIQVAIKFLGHIDTRYVYPPLCSAEGPGLEIAKRIEPTLFTVLTKDRKGKLLTRGNDDVEVILEGRGRKDINIIDNNDGSYTVTYIPIPIDENIIHVYVKGYPIQGSPFKVPFCVRNYQDINSPLIILGRCGVHVGEFQSPSGIAIDDKRCLLAVCDRDNKRIQLFDLSSYEHIRSLDVSQYMPSGPFDIAVDNKGRLLTTDPHGKGIFVFDDDGAFLYKIGSYGQEIGQLGGACFITVDDHNIMYVCDSDNCRIQVFDERGILLHCYGQRGQGLGEFNLPAGISIGNNGSVFIADRGNHRIQVFNKDGQFLYQFGSRGNQIGEFDFPHDLTTDIQSNIIVADHYNTRLQIFNCKGEFLHKIDNIVLPFCITSDTCGRIYTTTKDNKIYIF